MKPFHKTTNRKKGMPMKTTIKLFAILAIVFTGATASLAEIMTGWQSPLDGTYTWSDTANWVDGEINGIAAARAARSAAMPLMATAVS